MEDSLEFDVSTATVQDEDAQSGQVGSTCLRVSLILRTILQHISTTELLKLSLVNKLWCYEARTVLKNRGSLTRSLNTNRKCEDLRPFASSMKRGKENWKALPMSGITVILGNPSNDDSVWWHKDLCVQSTSEEMNQAYEDILNQITWRRLSVKFHWRWPDLFQNCPGFLLVKKILQKFGSVLEEFTLEFPKDRENFLQQSFQSCCNGLPRLKILNIRYPAERNDDYANLTKALVAHAPNLQVLNTSGWVDLSSNLLDGTFAVHTTDHAFSSSLNEIPESVTGRLIMTNLELTEISPDFQMDRFNRITFGLLEASRTTLSSMEIDALFLLPLTCYGICLENVKTLQLTLDYCKLEDLNPVSLRLVKSFDFTRILPKVTEMKLYAGSYLDYTTNGLDEIIEQGNAGFKEPLPDRAVNIKSLEVTCLARNNDPAARFVAEMFQDIETLSIEGSQIPYSHIWECWLDLKELRVKDLPRGRDTFTNLDSVFCGIFPEEVAQLREKDWEYLQRVNIVPVMPSITCLKGLESLCFIFGRSFVAEDEDVDPTYLFSKVVGEIGFLRCPALKVTVMSHDRRYTRALRYLKPYACLSLI